LRSIIHRNVTRNFRGADAYVLRRAPHHAAWSETIYDGHGSARHAASRDRRCARDALLRIRLAELRRAETLDHAISTCDANVRAVGLDSMPVPALRWIGRLSLARAYEQAPHRADTEKDADDGADPEPEHA
jgi:hypothetical protein